MVEFGSDGRQFRTDEEWNALFDQVLELMGKKGISLYSAAKMLKTHETSIRQAATRLRPKEARLKAFTKDEIVRRGSYKPKPKRTRAKKVVPPRPRYAPGTFVSGELPTVAVMDTHAQHRHNPFSLIQMFRAAEAQGVALNEENVVRIVKATKELNEALGLGTGTEAVAVAAVDPNERRYLSLEGDPMFVDRPSDQA